MKDEGAQRQMIRGRHAVQLHGGQPEISETVGVELAEAFDGDSSANDANVEAEAGRGERPKKRRRWAPWLILMVVIGMMVGLGIVGLMKFVNDPVETTSGQSSLAKAREKALASPTPSLNQLAGLYVEMSYPAAFDQVSQKKNDATTLEQYTLSSKSEYRRMIAVGVRALPSGKLDDDASYKIRHISPDTYKETTEKIGSETVVLMTKNDKQEQTLFWAHGGKCVTVAITSSATSDDVTEFMNVVKAQLRWRQ